MNTIKGRWPLLILGVTVFLAAFGVAFAVSSHPTWQVWQKKEGTATLNPLRALSSGDMVVSFDSTGDQQVVSLQFPTWHSTPPVRSWRRAAPQTVWFHNNTDTGVGPAVNLRPVDPCHEVLRKGTNQKIGKIEADSWLGGKWIGTTCQDDWKPEAVIPPGGMAKMEVRLHPQGNLVSGDTFDVVFGAVGSTGGKPAPLQVAFLTTWGTSGAADGQFDRPIGIAMDASGRVYVADTLNHRVQVFNGDGAFSHKWGSLGNSDGQFNFPSGIAVDESGNVYVADTMNLRVQVFSASGTFLHKWGTGGAGDGQFNFPSGIAVDSGKVYVTDHVNHSVQVFGSDGTFLRKWGSFGNGNGLFNTPEGIVINRSGTVYVADHVNHRVQVFSGDGTFLRKWGTKGPGDSQFNHPTGIALDQSGKVYVADRDNHRVQVFSSDGILLLKWGTSGTGNSQFNSPRGMVVDGSRRAYVVDRKNHRVQVFSVTGGQ